MHMNDEIIQRDSRLRKREVYICREHHVCLGLVILFLLIGAVSSIVDQTQAISERLAAQGNHVILFLLAYAYFCTLRIRHIESIKYYRSNNPSHATTNT